MINAVLFNQLITASEKIMPFKLFHNARIENPSKYVKFTTTKDELSVGVHTVYGITKDKNKEVQMLKFDVDKFTSDEAKKWLKDHDYDPIAFEEAADDGDEDDEKANAKEMDDESDVDDMDDNDDDDDDDEEEDCYKGKKIASTEVEHKTIMFKVIETKEATISGIKYGIIEGYASTYGNVDRGGDVIQRGAFKKCLQKYVAENRPIKMLYQHSMMDIIGIFPADKMMDDEKGLYCQGQINLEVQRGRETYALAKQGAISDMSIGYSVDDGELIQDPKTGGVVRQLKEVMLWEISPVGEPMNPDAKITEVKTSIKDLNALVVSGAVTKKSQLAKILRKSKGFTKSAAEHLVNMINLSGVIGGAKEEKKASEENKVDLLDQFKTLVTDLNKKEELSKQEKVKKDLDNLLHLLKK